MSDYVLPNHTLFSFLPELLLPWFAENARPLPWRADRKPYHVWLSEIMLQQTRIEAVRGYYLRFIEAFPTAKALAAAQEDTVLKYWEGLGYYSRARNLHRAARIIAENGFPETYEGILALPGVGAYTAGAVASICFGLPTPAVDGNVLRVAARLSDMHTPIDLPGVRKAVTDALRAVYPTEHCGDFTQSLMEFGEQICTPKSPKCNCCPLSGICLAVKHDTVLLLPLRSPKKERRREEMTVFLLQHGGRLALQKRPAHGLLASLWEFPHTDGFLSADEAARFAEKLGVSPEAPLYSMERIHTFTHIEWHMRGFLIPCREAVSDFVWADSKSLREDMALPTAFRIFLNPEEK